MHLWSWVYKMEKGSTITGIEFISKLLPIISRVLKICQIVENKK